jgi:hypothetical protein
LVFPLRLWERVREMEGREGRGGGRAEKRETRKEGEGR